MPCRGEEPHGNSAGCGVSVSGYTEHSISELDDDNCISKEQTHTVDIDMHTPNSPALEGTSDVAPSYSKPLLFSTIAKQLEAAFTMITLWR